MLSLRRKRDEVLWIGEARVVVHRVLPASVKLAIDAPGAIAVHREEVLKKIAEEEPERFAELGFTLTPTGAVARAA